MNNLKAFHVNQLIGRPKVEVGLIVQETPNFYAIEKHAIVHGRLTSLYVTCVDKYAVSKIEEAVL